MKPLFFSISIVPSKPHNDRLLSMDSIRLRGSTHGVTDDLIKVFEKRKTSDQPQSGESPIFNGIPTFTFPQIFTIRSVLRNDESHLRLLFFGTNSITTIPLTRITSGASALPFARISPDSFPKEGRQRKEKRNSSERRQ
jgi:hypothetical protein